MRTLFTTTSRTPLRRSALPLACLLLTACAVTREDLALRDRVIDELRVSLKKSEEATREETERRMAAAREAEDLRAAVEGECKPLREGKASCDAALARVAAHDAHVADVRGRLLRFRDRFATMGGSAQGVQVGFRRGRLVLALPADLVFDPGSVDLKKGGKDALRIIGSRIREDATFAGRTFLVAGHTDNSPYPVELPYRDNWGLSLARARQVLLFLTGPAQRPKEGPQPSELGGGVDPHQVVAVGFADTDPIAGTVDAQTREEQQKNRRVEIILEAAPDEMLDLGALP
jgi:chemotaxis protein MotB